MPIINETDFQKRNGEFSNIARREAVTVTRHGRASLVLLSAEDYQRLKQIEARSTKSMRTADLDEETIAAMVDADLSHLPAD